MLSIAGREEIVRKRQKRAISESDHPSSGSAFCHGEHFSFFHPRFFASKSQALSHRPTAPRELNSADYISEYLHFRYAKQIGFRRLPSDVL